MLSRCRLWMVNTLIGVYARRRQVDKAFALYEGLLQTPHNPGMEPNIFTYANLLNALAKVGRPLGCLGCGVHAGGLLGAWLG
jgi:pentatricopeptide repeat protein